MIPFIHPSHGHRKFEEYKQATSPLQKRHILESLKESFIPALNHDNFLSRDDPEGYVRAFEIMVQFLLVTVKLFEVDQNGAVRCEQVVLEGALLCNLPFGAIFYLFVQKQMKKQMSAQQLSRMEALKNRVYSHVQELASYLVDFEFVRPV